MVRNVIGYVEFKEVSENKMARWSRIYRWPREVNRTFCRTVQEVGVEIILLVQGLYCAMSSCRDLVEAVDLLGVL